MTPIPCGRIVWASIENRGRVVSLVLMCAALMSSACGGGGESGESSEKPTTTPESAVPKGADSSPGPTVRAFLNAYRSGDAKVACALVTSDFSRPGDRKARPPESCTRKDKSSNDPLVRHLLIVDTDPKPPVARVLTQNERDALFVFRLVREGSGWRVKSVGTQERTGSGKPNLPRSAG